MPTLHRWWIALAGVCIQLALGSAYAWSVFRIPLSHQFGWTISQVSLAFAISFCTLGCTAFLGGLWVNWQGPRKVAMVAAFLWGGGVFLTSFSANRLWWLYLTYGFIGGIGLGIGYIVPVAVLVKWFPDRRGLITGIAVGGFGAGPLITAPIATRLIHSVGLMPTFEYLGVGYLAVAFIGACFMQNPPQGWKPDGWNPTPLQTSQRSDRDYALTEALKTWQFWAICSLMLLNTLAGLSIMSQAAPMFEEIGKASAVIAAGLVGILSIGNGVGRIFWAWVSDLTTRKTAFFIMYLLQAILLWCYHTIGSVNLLAAVTFVIVMCYGGGYGVTPAFAADYFGSRNVGPIFGFMLFPWVLAAGFGPVLFASLRQSSGTYNRGLYFLAGIMTVSVIVPLVISPPRARTRTSALEQSSALQIATVTRDPAES